MSNGPTRDSGNTTENDPALDPIGAVAEARLQRIRREKQRVLAEEQRALAEEQRALAEEQRARDEARKIKRKKALGGTLIIAVASVVLAIWFANRDRPLKNPVAVLLPSIAEDGSVRDNARRQWAGFTAAFASKRDSYSLEEVDKDTNRVLHYCHFKFAPVLGKPEFKLAAGNDKSINQTGQPTTEPITDCTPNLLDQFEWWYEKQNKRVFVITMSGAVSNIRQGFKQWSKTKSEDPPVLVATVASAPDIADRNAGIYRYYVRSEDEVEVFANFIDSKNFITLIEEGGEKKQPRVFYVGDKYGERAADLVSKRFSLLPEHSYPLSIPDNKVEIGDKLGEWFGKFDSAGVSRSEPTFPVILIAYGENIRFALEKLRSERRFKGDILVASTYTECAWRLDWTFDGEKCKENAPGEITATGHGFRDRIYTVSPSRPGNDKAKYGVVYQFSDLTLRRAMRCGEESYGTPRKPFWDCWSGADSEESENIKVEITANGDSRVSLRLLTHANLN